MRVDAARIFACADTSRRRRVQVFLFELQVRGDP
jgi:hypothetical protein